MTPYYPFVEQVAAFHDALAQLYLEHGVDYDEHKRHCDDYFALTHRGETRGVGGVFFDSIHLNNGSFADTLRFVVALGRLVPQIVRPLALNARRPFSPAMRQFQLYRRGRYAEFNLLIDRGTRFGITSGGRTESILMSLPAVAVSFDVRPLHSSHPLMSC